MLDEALIVAGGDEHSGGATGLAPLDGLKLKDGESIPPSKLQRKIARFFEDAWKRVFSHGLPVVFFHMGDGVEGNHHGTTEVYGTPGDHLRNLEAMYEPILGRCVNKIGLRGTDAHVGPNGNSDDELARHMDFTPLAPDVYSAGHVRVSVAGVLVDAAHRGPGVGNTAHTKGNPMRGYARSIALSDLSMGIKPPKIVLRAHVHQAVKEVVTVGDHEVYGVITPSWQGKTSFANAVASHSHLADVGLACFHVKHGEVVRAWMDVLTYDDALTLNL